MKGYPKHLNSKADYEYVRKNFSKEQWEKDFQTLLSATEEWFNLGEVSDNGVTDDTHKVVADEHENKKYQYELKENPNAKIYRLGYTKEEVKAILAG